MIHACSNSPAPPVDGALFSFWLIADTIVKATAGVRLVDIDTTGMPDGTPCWVRSVEDLWILNRTSTLTPDNITIANAIAGGGQWIRKELPSLVWQEQMAWFIDPISGNDENLGFTGLSALKTDAERQRRWGEDPFSPQVAISVTVESALPVTDVVSVNLAPTTNPVTFQGVPVPARPASTLTAGTTGLVDGTSLPVLEDTSITDWTADVGKRIRLIAKAVTSFVGQDVGGGSQKALTGAFGGPTFGGVNPASGDDYIIEDLTAITIGELVLEATDGSLRFIDLDITSAETSVAREVVFQQCKVGGSIAGLGAFYFGCGSTQVGVGATAGVSIFLTCTFVLNGLGVDVGLCIFSSVCAAIASTSSGIDVGFSKGTAVFAPDGSGNSACALVNNTTEGLAVGSIAGPTDPVAFVPGTAVIGALVWGAGNGARGARVGSGSLIIYGDGTGGAIGGFLTVTGALGDTLVGGTPKAYGALPFFQGTNGAGIVAAT